MNAQEFGALPADGNPDALRSQEGLPVRPIKMTLEEFLESDLEGYEVVSPTDTLFRIEEKAFAYLDAGTQLVWVLMPRSKTVTVYRSETDITLRTRNDTLTGENVIEGFSCQVAELFA